MVAGGNGCNATHTAEARIAGCSSDTDCSGRPFGYVEQSVCDTSPGPFTGLCRMPNAKPLLAKALGGAVCTATSGQRQCAAGVCSTLDNACGLTNGEVAVDSVGAPTTDSKVCRSNVINADGRCGQPNSDPLAGPPVQNACTDPNPAPVVSGACRSGVCFSQAGASNAADNECGEPNGEPCASNAVCRTVCTAADGTCGLLNGASCTQAAACRSGVCNADGKCGNPNGDRCQFATTCRSGICKAGVCSPTCATDANCGGAFWCETTTAQCVADGPTGAKPKGSAGAPVSCDRAAQCLSGACGTMDGLCGLPDGTACPVDVRQCRAGLCTAGACGKGCAVDADCGAGAYCEDSNPAAKSCVRSEPNGAQTGPAAGPKTTACTTARGAAQCASGLCNADGQCGDPDGAACASASTCRSGGCQGGVCGAGCAPKGASGDAQCAPSFYCTNPAAPATSGTCTTDAGNGAKPSDGAGGTTACDRPGQCASNVCNADGLCGQPDGAACASAGQCRTNVCLAGLCGAATGCLADANCKVTDYCKTPGPGTGACTPKTANDTACTAGNTCLTSVCNADGKCGQPKGQSCGANVLCRSQLCDLTQLKCVGCTQDAQCSAGQSCEATVSECKDKDTDGDGILDKNEWGTGGAASPQDTDGDGTPDWKDTDDDGDGLLTKDELGPGGATSPRDTDGDGKPDYVDADDDNDGILTSREIADGKLPGVSSDDVDADGKKNWLDTDSDGDGLLDANEKGDANTNGIPDYLEVAKPVAPVVPNADAGAPVLPVLPGTPDAGAPAKAQDNGSVAGGGLNCAAAFGVLPDASTAALGILMLAFCTRRKAKNRAA